MGSVFPPGGASAGTLPTVALTSAAILDSQCHFPASGQQKYPSGNHAILSSVSGTRCCVGCLWLFGAEMHGQSPGLAAWTLWGDGLRTQRDAVTLCKRKVRRCHLCARALCAARGSHLLGSTQGPALAARRFPPRHLGATAFISRLSMYRI